MDSRNTRAALVMSIANAIAFAEGYYKPLSVPRVCNNPGDLKHAPDKYVVIAKTTNGILHFATAINGWAALYNQIHLMLDNGSGVYHSGMTLYEVSQHWTQSATEANAWAINMAWHLRVLPDTKLCDIEARMEDVCAL